MANREAATQELLKWVDKLLPGSDNTQLWADRLGKMTNAQFGEFMNRLESGDEVISLIVPNLNEHRLSVPRNLALAKELGHEFFERLWLTDPHTGETYLTPVKYLVVDLPLRRQVQTLEKKVSISTGHESVDELTGQRASTTKGSKMSFPEIQVLYAQGYDRSIIEMIKYRGGDEEGGRSMNRQVIETGGVSMDSLANSETRTKSVETLSTLLKASHLDNNL